MLATPGDGVWDEGVDDEQAAKETATVTRAVAARAIVSMIGAFAKWVPEVTV